MKLELIVTVNGQWDVTVIPGWFAGRMRKLMIVALGLVGVEVEMVAVQAALDTSKCAKQESPSHKFRGLCNARTVEGYTCELELQHTGRHMMFTRDLSGRVSKEWE